MAKPGAGDEVGHFAAPALGIYTRAERDEVQVAMIVMQTSTCRPNHRINMQSTQSTSRSRLARAGCQGRKHERKAGNSVPGIPVAEKRRRPEPHKRPRGFICGRIVEEAGPQGLGRSHLVRPFLPAASRGIVTNSKSRGRGRGHDMHARRVGTGAGAVRAKQLYFREPDPGQDHECPA